MKRRKLLLCTTFALALLAVPFMAGAQQPGKIPTIGYLSNVGSLRHFSHLSLGFWFYNAGTR